MTRRSCGQGRVAHGGRIHRGLTRHRCERCCTRERWSPIDRHPCRWHNHVADCVRRTCRRSPCANGYVRWVVGWKQPKIDGRKWTPWWDAMCEPGWLLARSDTTVLAWSVPVRWRMWARAVRSMDWVWEVDEDFEVEPCNICHWLVRWLPNAPRCFSRGTTFWSMPAWDGVREQLEKRMSSSPSFRPCVCRQNVREEKKSRWLRSFSNFSLSLFGVVKNENHVPSSPTSRRPPMTHLSLLHSAEQCRWMSLGVRSGVNSLYSIETFFLITREDKSK